MTSPEPFRLFRLVTTVATIAALFAAGAVGPSEAARGEIAKTRGDLALRRVLEARLAGVELAGRAAAEGRGSSAQIQAQYDAARDLDEALASVGRISEGCRPLLAAATAFARAHVMQAEGADRFSPSLVAKGVSRAAATGSALSGLERDCGGGALETRSPEPPELDEPGSSEAFAGPASTLAPRGTDQVDVLIAGAHTGRATLRSRRASFDAAAGGKGHNIEFQFRKDGALIGTARSTNTWRLPDASTAHRGGRVADTALTAELAALGEAFDGQAGIWVHDLSRGSTAGWNEDALFPAASTVKLGVMVAALKRFGPRPERSGLAYDIGALAAWSSNLAANRLIRILGRGSSYSGSLVVESTLHALGASSSSYPGEYLVGTAFAQGAPDPPPRVSSRVTTARDLGRILFTLHAASMGDRPALRRTGLTRHEARVGIAMLLASEPGGDNAGLVREGAGARIPIAQKNGWLRDARHTAAVIYSARGPVVVVVLTYRSGLRRSEALALGTRVTRAALLGRRG